MNNLIWLMRASRWARNPPGPRMVKRVLAVILIGLVLVGLEHWGLWPDWARLERPPRGVRVIRP